MRTTARFALGVALTLVVAFTIGVGRSSDLAASTGTRPSTPTIVKVTPDPIVLSSRPQVIVVEGKEFMPALTLLVRTPDGGSLDFKGSAIEDQRATSFQVSVLLDTAGTYHLTVVNTDGGTSDPFLLKVGAAPAPDGPVIEKVTPAETTKSDTAQDIQVDGQRFDAGMRVYVTDPVGEAVTDLTVGPIRAGTFRMRVRLDKTGTYELTVVNPSGAASPPASITVR